MLSGNNQSESCRSTVYNFTTMSKKRTPPERQFLSSHLSKGSDWISLDPAEGEEPNDDSAARLREHLKMLLTGHRVILLAGSGTSLSEDGPSMGKLWNEVAKIDTFDEIKEAVSYDPDENIEGFLSQCHNAKPFISTEDAAKIEEFVKEAESTIYKECSDFLSDDKELVHHESLLRKLTRRRSKAPRPVLITTNYDRCFEIASSHLGLTIVDGFSYSQPRYFDPNYFGFDFVRKSHHGNEANEPVEGVLHLLKIHGSVDWEMTNGGVKQTNEPADGKRCLIYPASTKYQHSYTQPYLEMMARYLTALREPQTSLFIVGFGFNDDHLSAPILSAIRSNHSLNVVAVAPSLVANEASSDLNSNWEELAQLARANQNRVTLINADFGQFVELIPDLKGLTPDQNLVSALSRISTGKSS